MSEEDSKLTAVEAELYDRQIRLWGIESQEKLRNASVLVIGARGLGCEIIKNILLAGVRSLTVLDDGEVTKEDLRHNFLLSARSPVGVKIADEVVINAQALNPLVCLTACSVGLAVQPDAFFEQFTIVVITTLDFANVIRIGNICRASKIKVIYGDVFGYFGFSVSDFQEHDYFEDRIVLTGTKRNHQGEKKTKRIQNKLKYPALNKVLVLPNTKQDLADVKKKPSNFLFILMLTLIDFRKRHNRNPQRAKKSADIEELKKISEEVQDLYQTTFDLDEYFELLFDEVGPVCAVVGGVIAQEAIKAVSGKEVTINNVFLFDPLKYNGKEFCVGV